LSAEQREGEEPDLVRVLLSTFNSTRFIRPLLESVLGQTYAPLELWVRDDGSSDATTTILEEYARQHPGRMHIESGPNLGMVPSYFTLIRSAGRVAEYTALCGHDDVWHPDKIERAVDMLQRQVNSRPALYSGRLRIIDDADHLLEHSLLPTRPLSFRNALVESVGAGCTMVMNRSARDLVIGQHDLTGVIYEDWWFYLVVSAFGSVLYDTHAAIDYRRHSTNAVGSPVGWRRVVNGWRTVRQGALPRQLRGQALALRREFGSRLSTESRAMLDAFLNRPASLAGRIRYALSCPVYRQRRLDGAVVRAMLMFDDGD
jgi:glycosyltransferase involved in cell wall biosynthesis